MKIFSLTNNIDDNYRRLVCVNSKDSLIVTDVIFKLMDHLYVEDIQVSYMSDEYMDRNSLVLNGDYPTLYNLIPVFSKRAISILSKRINTKWTLFGLNSKDGDFFLCRPHRIADCIDIKNSIINSYRQPFIGEYTKLNFYSSSLREIDIFMVDRLASDVFVTEKFVEVCVNEKLTGMKFVPVN